MITAPAENKTITTPSGHEVVLKGYLTGKDHRDFRMVLVSLGDISKSEGIQNVENALINACVVSLDGSSENLLENLLALPVEDYTAVVESAQEVIQSLTKKKEAISTGNTTTGSKENQ